MAKLILAGGANVLAVEHDVPGRWLDQPVDAAQQRGFTGAGQADNDQELAVGHGERHIVKGACAVGINLAQVLDFKHSR